MSFLQQTAAHSVILRSNCIKTILLKHARNLFIAFISLFFAAQPVLAQQENNPFELTPRLDAVPVPVRDSAIAAVSSNPFDLVAPSTAATAPPTEQIRPGKPKKVISEASAYRRFLFISLMLTLVLLTLLMTFLRPFFQKVYSAFRSDNLFNQVYREREAVGLLPFVLLYVLFFLNAGLFVYLLLHHYKIAVAGSHLLGWLYCTAAVTGVLFFKHLTLNIIGAVFPVQKEVGKYNFLIIVFGIVAALVLMPINILLAYGPEGIASYLIYLTGGTLALLYVFRHLRGLIVANRFVAFHRFHFLLYICTVEIAPVLFLVKLLANQI